MKYNSIVGKKFGRWLVLGMGKKNKQRSYLVVCKCECGTEREVIPNALVRGARTSCGCLRIENMMASVTKHGLSKSLTYVSWRGMIGRCYDPGNASYRAYSQKGVTVCDRWLPPHGFENFLEDMGERSSKDYSLDRIDNRGNYLKENCRWATRYEQQENRDCAKTITALGETKMLSEWARLKNMQYQTLKARIRAGWDPDDAVSRPLEVHNRRT